MCDIWREKARDMDLTTFERLVQSTQLRGLRSITLTGGEPFLVPNLVEYVQVTRHYHPRAHLNISTNGSDAGLVSALLRSIDSKRLSLTVSFDGISSHDTVRQVPGASSRLLQTIALLKVAHPKVPVALKTTATPWNSQEILQTGIFVRSMGLPWEVKVVDDLACYHNRLGTRTRLGKAASEALARQLVWIARLRLARNSRHVRYLLKPEGCPAPANLFVNVDGQTFLCRHKPSLGNVRQGMGFLKSARLPADCAGTCKAFSSL